MSKSKSKKFRLLLGFLIFFVLFLPFTGDLLTAQAKDISSSDQTTTVKEVLPEIKLNVKSKELVKGKSYNLKVYNTTDNHTIQYKSSDNSIVMVSDTGYVTGVEIGTATITVTVKEGAKIISTLQCDITVGVPALSIRFTRQDLLLVVGQKTTLRVLVAPYNTVETTRYTTLDSEVASISTGGRITAKTEGTTYVYALIDNGFSRCKVTVISEETYAALNELGVTDLSDVSSIEPLLVEIASNSAIQVATPQAISTTNGSKSTD